VQRRHHGTCHGSDTRSRRRSAISPPPEGITECSKLLRVPKVSPALAALPLRLALVPDVQRGPGLNCGVAQEPLA